MTTGATQAPASSAATAPMLNASRKLPLAAPPAPNRGAAQVAACSREQLELLELRDAVAGIGGCDLRCRNWPRRAGRFAVPEWNLVEYFAMARRDRCSRGDDAQRPLGIGGGRRKAQL